MLTRPKLTLLALALAAALPAAAQSNAEVLNEIKALRDRVNQLEQQLKESQAKAAAAPQPQWGMTPEQAAELNRLTVKTEALEDSREASGFMGLKISGQMQAAYIYNQRAGPGGLPVPGFGGQLWLQLLELLHRHGHPGLPEGDDRRHQVAPDAGPAARRGFGDRRVFHRAGSQRLGAADRPADALHRRPDPGLVGLRVPAADAEQADHPQPAVRLHAAHRLHRRRAWT